MLSRSGPHESTRLAPACIAEHPGRVWDRAGGGLYKCRDSAAADIMACGRIWGVMYVSWVLQTTIALIHLYRKQEYYRHKVLTGPESFQNI